MPYPDEDFKDDHTPVGFLISFRCFGTWLHGDRRGSVDRFHNVYGTPKLGPERARVRYERNLMTRPPVCLNAQTESCRRKGSERRLQEARLAIVGSQCSDESCSIGGHGQL